MAEVEYFDDPSLFGRRAPQAQAYPYGAEHYQTSDDPYDAPDQAGSRLSALVNWAGALVSLGLVVGMGVWAYQLTMRDVSGVPVIQALEGPMRVPPEDPGGAQAPHQGLAVNRIAEGAEAEAVPDQLVLAPPPVDLDNLAPISGASAAAENPDINDETQAIIERLLSRGSALEPLQEADQQVAAPAVEEPVADPQELRLIPASVPGVSRSLRPSLRPETIASSSASVAEDLSQTEVTAAADEAELAPESLAAGTRLVQLGAFDSADIARSEWERLANRFPDFLAGRARVIEEARSGGQAFFRLRAHGFADLAEARRFCTALVAQGAACIPVTVR